MAGTEGLPADSRSGRLGEGRGRGETLVLILQGAVALLAVFVLLHYAHEFRLVLAAGADKAAIAVDFQTYLCGAADMIRPYDRCHIGEAVSGFVYPPPSLPYFHALALLPVNVAFVAHSLVGLISLGVASAMMWRMVEGGRVTKAAALLAALAIAPIGTSFVAGQVNVIVMACCVAAVWFALRDRAAASGAAVAIGFWLKLYPAIVPVLFLSRRMFPSAVFAAAIALVVGGVSLAWLSPGLYLQYFTDLLPHVQRFTMPGVAYSIVGLIAHAQAGGGAPVSHFVPVAPALLMASRIILLAGIGLAVVHQRFARGRYALDSLGILLVAALVAAPNSWGYHYALIFPALFPALCRGLGRFSWRTPVVLLCWLALVVPGWTDPPGLVAQEPWLNVPIRGRYVFAALTLVVMALIEVAGHARAAAFDEPSRIL